MIAVRPKFRGCFQLSRLRLQFCFQPLGLRRGWTLALDYVFRALASLLQLRSRSVELPQRERGQRQRL